MSSHPYLPFDGDYNAALERADAIASGHLVTDAERLRAVADFLDALDINRGVKNDTEMQEDIRRIADRLDAPEGVTPHDR